MSILRALDYFPDDVARDGAGQMALDEALSETAQRPILRVYQWDGAAASFGYSQSLAEVRHLHPAVPLVRRWTGGGIVEHGSDWTFALIVPRDEPLAGERVEETYRRIHVAVQNSLLASGIEARLAGAEDCRCGMACFVAPALHDVIGMGGRKLCGGAQRRTRRGFLHQGSVQNETLPPDFGTALCVELSASWQSYLPEEYVFARMSALKTTKYGTEVWRTKIP